MTVDWPTRIHAWHQLGDNILNDWYSVLYHAVYTLSQGPISPPASIRGTVSPPASIRGSKNQESECGGVSLHSYIQ